MFSFFHRCLSLSVKEILRRRRFNFIQHSTVDLLTHVIRFFDPIDGLFSTARKNLPIADMSKTEDGDDCRRNQHRFVVEQLKCPPTDPSSHTEGNVERNQDLQFPQMFPRSNVEDRLANDQTNICENSRDVRRANHRTGERRAQTVLKTTGESDQISRDIQRHANAIDRPRRSLKNSSSFVQMSSTYCNEISRGQSDTFEKQCQSVGSLDSKGRSADQRPGDETSRDERDDREEKMQGRTRTSIREGIDHSRRSAGRCRDRTFEETNQTDGIDESGDERQNTTSENQGEKRSNSIRTNVSSWRDDRRSTLSSHPVRCLRQERNSRLNPSSRTFGFAFQVRLRR